MEAIWLQVSYIKWTALDDRFTSQKTKLWKQLSMPHLDLERDLDLLLDFDPDSVLRLLLDFLSRDLSRERPRDLLLSRERWEWPSRERDLLLQQQQLEIWQHSNCTNAHKWTLTLTKVMATIQLQKSQDHCECLGPALTNLRPLDLDLLLRLRGDLDLDRLKAEEQGQKRKRSTVLLGA